MGSRQKKTAHFPPDEGAISLPICAFLLAHTLGQAGGLLPLTGGVGVVEEGLIVMFVLAHERRTYRGVRAFAASFEHPRGGSRGALGRPDATDEAGDQPWEGAPD